MNFDIFNMFAQNIDCGYRLKRLNDAVITSAHNLCFGLKIRKMGIPLYTPVLYTKVGCKGELITWACFPDGPQMSLCVRKPTIWVPTRSDTNKPV